MTCLTHPRTLPIAPAAVVVCCLLLAVVSPTSTAATIVYSWEGTLRPLNAEVDPWDIGAEDKPFSISVAVNADALDDTNDVDFAAFHAFDLTDARLSLDGVRAGVGEGNRIWFFDDASTDSIDLLFRNVLFNGVVEQFDTVVRLPASTFTLEEEFETPPAFPNKTTKGGGVILRGGSSYWVFVDGGVTVTGTLVPKPSTFVLALVAMLGTAITFRRRRNK